MTMQRTVLLIKPEQYKKMHSLAKKEHVSLAEINRRAIDQYINEPQEDMQTLGLMVEALIRSNKEAKKALEDAEKNLNEVIGSLRHKKD
jgi:hypothetical protein